MANTGGFSLDLTGLETVIARLDQLEDDLDRRLDETLTKIALKIIHDARRLAPLDEGDLEAALEIDKVKHLIGLAYIDFGTTPDVNAYAVIQHEGFNKTPSGAIVQLQPGEKTLSKGNYNGYSPGKKFLENAIKMNEKWIMEELSGILKGW
ncbi:HK97 gp10 family phage protein [Paenibacillus tianjinensis]|uniref:HK97 gp10 family phage protein n=1 Tax=Paenibacillus tianjinensis TaxID=2810347 RepID=A0ABX7L617_9BACL|nr:HK97 gp10 family phage protein [Paenibacillus tianjinensis]QSF42661.1 HK97 gp10 family phage protein [Paenibacillus tianjinensis]